jgi:hypothetical protein
MCPLFEPLKILRVLYKNWNKYYDAGVRQPFNFLQTVLTTWQTREIVRLERY